MGYSRVVGPSLLFGRSMTNRFRDGEKSASQQRELESTQELELSTRERSRDGTKPWGYWQSSLIGRNLTFSDRLLWSQRPRQVFIVLKELRSPPSPPPSFFFYSLSLFQFFLFHFSFFLIWYASAKPRKNRHKKERERERAAIEENKNEIDEERSSIYMYMKTYSEYTYKLSCSATLSCFATRNREEPARGPFFCLRVRIFVSCSVLWTRSGTQLIHHTSGLWRAARCSWWWIRIYVVLIKSHRYT